MSKTSNPNLNKARRAVLREIARHERFLIVSHERGDGDSIGSEMALSASLRAAGKKVSVIKSDHCPPRYEYLQRSWMKQNISPTAKLRADCVIALDIPETYRMGEAALSALPSTDDARWISIDHHLGHTQFAHVNWVDPGASSVGEMIYGLVTAGKLPMPNLTRDALYTAIVTDTGQFAFSNTTAHTLRVAADLLDRGCDGAKLVSMINESKTAPELELERRARNSLTVSGPLAYVSLRQADFKAAKAGPEHIQEVISIARSIRDVRAAALFYELNDGQGTKASLRGKNGFDVRAVAMKFGGGGHKLAAGCSIAAPLDVARKRVLAEMRRRLKMDT